jgi:hypothetical protein
VYSRVVHEREKCFHRDTGKNLVPHDIHIILTRRLAIAGMWPLPHYVATSQVHDESIRLISQVISDRKARQKDRPELREHNEEILAGRARKAIVEHCRFRKAEATPK